MMDETDLYDQYADRLEDFWNRRRTRPRFRREVRVFGRALVVASNEEGVLTAVDLAQSSYTTAAPVDGPLLRVQLVVQSPPQPVGPTPDDLMQRITYSGDGGWLMLQLGQWGQAHVDLEQGRATAVLTPELARRPDLISQCLLHTIWLNFFIVGGYGLLHASCLVRDGRAALLLAPHNAGKSTTALHLALAGFRLLTDSMVFVAPSEPLQLLGFPVGKVKLRRDMLSQFVTLRPLLAQEVVRRETKFRLDLRQVAGVRVQETAVFPTAVDLYLMSRHDRAQTIVKQADKTSVWTAVMDNSLYFDRRSIWEQNLRCLTPLIEQARFFHLTIGTDAGGIVDAFTRLS